ncbi:MAG: hypothetical protein EOO77_19015 [Oxalobacteraceae bacterium]|nr:MAG: hypothetical protein EOO77_19015 [Oxalobacteraceae bacterium]
MFDGDPSAHFVAQYPVDVVKFNGGSDAASFLNTLRYVSQRQAQWDPSDIVYFTEDDFWHKEDWPTIMREGFHNARADIISLYDHRDKYTGALRPCEVTCTDSCHWRSAVSTVNTFALRYGCLMEDMDVYKDFANPAVSRVCVDHERFLRLYESKGRRLFTCIPARSTHCEREHLSPVVPWP